MLTAVFVLEFAVVIGQIFEFIGHFWGFIGQVFEFIGHFRGFIGHLEKRMTFI